MKGGKMSYQEFKIEYLKLMKSMFSYSPDQVGSSHFAEKLGELVDSNPAEYEEKIDAEIENGLTA